MAKEEIILDFKVEQGEAIAELEQTKIAIINLKKEQKDLNDQYKKGSISTEQYAKSSVKLEGELKKNTTAYNENLKASKGITTQFDKLIQSVDKIVPGLGGVTSGFNGITKGALAFIATPIGAVIGALGLALGAVTSYLKGTEEGQHKMNTIMNVGAAIVGKLLDAVQALGKFIIGNLVKAFDSVIGFLNEWVPGFEAATEALGDFLNLDVADHLSAMEEERVALNRLLITERGRLRNEIEAAKLRAESTKDIKLRTEALKEVEKLTNELFDKETRLGELERDIAIENGKLANNTIEDNDKIAESIAKVDDIERQRSAALKENATKQLAVNEQAKAERKIQQEEEAAEAEQVRILELINAKTHADAIIQIETDAALQTKGIDQNILKNKIKLGEQETKEKKKQAEIQKLIDENKLQGAMSGFRLLSGLAKEGTVVAKAAGLAQATIDTYIAANKAFAAGGGVPFGSILAALTIAAGLANVAKIVGITAAAGGGSFETRGPQLMVVGDNPGGRERVDVTPLSGKGRTVVGGGMIRMAGGGSVVANASSNRIDQNFGNIFKGANLSVSWVEGQNLGNKIKFKEDLVTL